MAGPSEVGSPSNIVQSPTVPWAVRMAQELTDGTSEKYVPVPTADAILADQISMIQITRSNVRRRAEHIKLRRREEGYDLYASITNQPGTSQQNNTQPNSRRDDGDDDNFWVEVDAETIPKPPTGMKTGLYDKFKGRTNSPSDHDQTELFLDDLEKVLGSQLRHKVLGKDSKYSRQVPQFDKDLKKILKDLGQEKEWILVPSDKTNRWIPTQVEEYMEEMHRHIGDKCKVITQERLTSIYKEASLLLIKFASSSGVLLRNQLSRVSSSAKYINCSSALLPISISTGSSWPAAATSASERVML